MKYYQICQLDRNEITNDRIIQRDRVVKQYKNERELAIKGEYLQVKKYAKDNEINAKEKSNDYIKKWIIILKKYKEDQKITNQMI